MVRALCRHLTSQETFGSRTCQSAAALFCAGIRARYVDFDLFFARRRQLFRQQYVRGIARASLAALGYHFAADFFELDVVEQVGLLLLFMTVGYLLQMLFRRSG